MSDKARISRQSNTPVWIKVEIGLRRALGNAAAHSLESSIPVLD